MIYFPHEVDKVTDIFTAGIPRVVGVHAAIKSPQINTTGS
jgi:hypothetical protein